MSSDIPRPTQLPAPRVLPGGTRLGEFELREVVGAGGFGIVYLAYDHSLEREVAVKEYMPASLVGRTETLHVSLRSQSDAETFQLGLRSFINEARLLARFDHPSLLKVYRYWEANGTAYMAMPVLRGQTLKALRLSSGEAPSEERLRGWLTSLLEGLRQLHDAGVYHRDIAPDNIQIEPDGRAVLLDFGAARRVVSDKTQTLTAILKPAYAPIEQYGEAGSVKQGPWTDFYALGATVHFLMTGSPPAPATVRALQDEAAPLAQQALPGYSQQLLQAVDWMLAPRPTDRPPTVQALLEVLQGRAQAPARAGGAPLGPPPDLDATVIVPRGADGRLQTAPWQSQALRQPPTDDLDATRVSAPTGGQRGRNDPPLAPPPASQGAGAAAGAGRPAASAAAGGKATAAAASGQPQRAGMPPLRLAALGGVGLALLAGLAWWLLAARGPDAGGGERAQAATAASAAAQLPAADDAASAASASEPARAGEPGQVAPGAPGGAAADGAASPGTAPPGTGAAAGAAPGALAGAATAAKPSKPPPGRKPDDGKNAAPPQPVREQPVPEPAPVTPAPAPPPVVPPSAPAPAEAPADNPAAICKSANPFRQFACMERECVRRRFMQHPDCLKWRENMPRESN